MAENDRKIVSIVDDDESLRRSLRNLLGSVGFRVETFASAEAFLESDHQEQTGCLVLDLRMPGMDGFDLLRHLSSVGARIPTVILTAHGDEEARQRSLQAGAGAFLSKPFNGNALLDAVRTALNQDGRRRG
jgi:two-component system response regulator FixJ